MSRRTGLIIICLVICIGFTCWYGGKRSADRWWQAHQMKCEPVTVNDSGGNIPIGTQPYTLKQDNPQISELSHTADEIIKKLEYQQAENEWRDATISLLHDCANVDAETWEKNHCDKRKKKWQDWGKTFTKP